MFSKKGAKSGTGLMRWTSGDTYEGAWLDGKMHGVGRYRKGDGSGKVYDGQWVAHVREGRGVETILHGDRYEGGWHDNAKHGLGHVRYTNGKVRDGRWRAGKHERWLGKERLMKGRR